MDEVGGAASLRRLLNGECCDSSSFFVEDGVGGVSFIVGAGVCELWRTTETWNWGPPHSNPIQYKAMYLL